MSVTYKKIETNEPKKAYCSVCEGFRNCKVHSHIQQISESDDPEDFISAYTDLFTVSCCGCDNSFFVLEYTFSEDIDPITGELITSTKIFPDDRTIKNKRFGTYEIARFFIKNQEIDKLYTEIYIAINSRCFYLALMGMRTLLDKVCVAINGKDENSFARNLEQLETNGIITKDQKGHLVAALEAGHSATHRIYKPTQEVASLAMDIIEGFLERYMNDAQNAARIQKTIPVHTSKTKKASKQTT